MSLDFINSFRDKSVFVTGHTGFKGSWLTLWLNRLGAHVTGYSLAPPTDPSNFVTSNVERAAVKNYQADIREYSRLQAAMKAAQPDVVFHLAAQALVRKSYLEPRQTFEVNAMGTANLLEGVLSLGRACTVIVVTTDKCYDNANQERGHRETDPLGGNDPYSASKGAAEIITASYRKSFCSAESLTVTGVKIATVRAGNVIGGGDWGTDRIVPDAVKALSIGQPVAVRNPASIRPWQHVLEPLSGYLTLAARMLSSNEPGLCGGWNFGPSADSEATVEQLVEAVCKAFGKGTWKKAGSAPQPGEEKILRLDITKAREQLGWQPCWGFEETIERTSRWYRAFYENPGRSTRNLCAQDISEYESASSIASGDFPFMPLQNPILNSDRASG
jgi:CDP-glucose 4,6-dehydratase